MASPQTDNGYTRIANEIVDAMAGTHLNGRQGQLLWTIFRRTYGYQKKDAVISLELFEKITGIKHRHVAAELRVLEARRIILVTRHATGNTYAFQKDYEVWDAVPSSTEKSTTQLGVSSTENGTVSSTENGTVSSTENGTHERKKESKRNMRVTDDFLPSAEQQAAILFGSRRHNNGCQEAEQAMARCKWTIGDRDLHDAAVYFIAASGIAPPGDKSTRRDWLATLRQHIEAHGVGVLEELYVLAVKHNRGKGLPAGRPGALTKALPELVFAKNHPDMGKAYEL